MSDCFQGTTALVTGASSGLGEQIARQLAARGCHLVLVARSQEKLQGLATELSQTHGVRAQAIALDLAVLGSVEVLCSDLTAQGIVIDHVVNNAGFGSADPLLSSDSAEQQQMLLLNALTPLLLARQLLPSMVERRTGGVINVASVAAFFPIPFMGTYAASKAFVLRHTQALAEEIRDSGVRIMALCPGPVHTGFQERAGYELGKLEQLAALSSADVVRAALTAYERKKTLCVPGFLNKVEVWLPRVIPASLLGPLVGAIMRWMGRG